MDELLLPLRNNTDSLYEEIIRENLNKRILVINEEIDENIVENYTLYILKWNAEDKDIPINKRKKITILINSPGGSTLDGFGGLVDVMLVSKTPIRTVCLGMAASMAYHIYLAGGERIALPHSILLQHDGEIAVQNSTSKAKQTMQFFDTMELKTKEYVLSRTTMTEEFYDKVYDQEYWFYANKEGKELGCVHEIIGEDIDLDEII